MKFALRAAASTAVLALLVLAACGAKLVKNQPPFVQVSSWRSDATALHVDLRIRNVNDTALEIQRLRLEIVLRDSPLLTYDAPYRADVAANGFEVLNLQFSAAGDSIDLLAELESGVVNSLPYSLEGSVETAAGKKLKFDHQGHVYAVPGKPGHFR